LPLALSGGPDHARSDSSTNSGVSTLARLGREYQQSVSALAEQAVPYATDINNADSDAAAATTSWQQTSQQLEQEIVASYGQSVNPTSESSKQEQQCLQSADSLDNPPSASGLDQMESAIDQCLQEGLSQQDQYGKELTQGSQNLLTQLQADAAKASAAYGHLRQIFTEELALTSGLSVPSRLSDLKQQVPSELGVVIRDAVAGEAVVGEPVPSLATKLAADLSVVSGQVNSLTTAMGVRGP